MMIKYYIEYQYYSWEEIADDYWDYTACTPVYKQIFDDEQEMSSVIYRLKKEAEESNTNIKILGKYICELRKIRG